MQSEAGVQRRTLARVVAWLVVFLVAGGLVWGWSRMPAEGVVMTFDFAPSRVAWTEAAPADAMPVPLGAPPVPAIAATAVPTAPRAVRRARAVRTTQAAVQATRRSNWISAPDVNLGVRVGHYTDCSGAAPLTRSEAQTYDCTPADLTVILGHNPGVFTPLVRARVGERVDYWDGSGADRAFSISEIHRVTKEESYPYVQDGSHTHLVLVTCAVPDGSIDWVILAEPVN